MLLPLRVHSSQRAKVLGGSSFLCRQTRMIRSSSLLCRCAALLSKDGFQARASSARGGLILLLFFQQSVHCRKVGAMLVSELREVDDQRAACGSQSGWC